MAVTKVVVARDGIPFYFGLSSDTKPTASTVPPNSKFYETDTDDVYVNTGSSWSLTQVSTRNEDVIRNDVTALLDGASSTGAGSSVEAEMRKKTFVATISDTATVKIQASHDDSDWRDVYTFTASGEVSVDDARAYWRGNVTSYSSGTVDLDMCE